MYAKHVTLDVASKVTGTDMSGQQDIKIITK